MSSNIPQTPPIRMQHRAGHVTKQPMPITREQELWGMALWVEKHHGENGWLYIAQQQDRLLEEGDHDGAALWREVASRFDQLMERKQSN